MGEATRRKVLGLGPRAQKPEDLKVVIKTEDDGTFMIEILNLNGAPSSAYYYSTDSGKLEEIYKAPMEWIGRINISPSFPHRVWATTANLLQSWNIPTEPKELKRFIKARGKGKSWYRIKFGDKGTGSIYLPNLLYMAERVQEYPDKDRGYVSSVVVAPHRQRQGFGLQLHKLAASFLKTLGYTTMVSDTVGMNTDGEIAVWKALKKEALVTPFKLSFSMSKFLRKANIIDDKMFKLMQKMGMHINGSAMTLEAISKKRFQQFELNLADKRIPILPKPSVQQSKKAA